MKYLKCVLVLLIVFSLGFGSSKAKEERVIMDQIVALKAELFDIVNAQKMLKDKYEILEKGKIKRERKILELQKQLEGDILHDNEPKPKR